MERKTWSRLALALLLLGGPTLLASVSRVDCLPWQAHAQDDDFDLNDDFADDAEPVGEDAEDEGAGERLTAWGIIKAGGFNTDFWPGEDTVICLKITKELKKKIIYDPDVYVKHHRRPLFLPHLKQVKSYALHRGYFVKKFPATSLKFSYFCPSLLLLGILAGGIGGLFYPAIGRFYFLALFTYLGLAFLRGIKSMNIKLIFPVFLGIILTHFTYGFYFIRGLLAKRMPEE